MFLKKFTHSEINTLKIKFKNLSSIEEKLKFWNDILDYPYYLTHELSHTDIRDFLIHCHSSNEKEQLNTLIIEEITFKRTFNVIDSEKEESKILKLLSEMNNPIPFLLERLSETENIIHFKKVQSQRKNVDNHIESETSKFFINSYEEYFLKGKDIDLSKSNLSTPNLVAQINGAETAKFKLFLERQIKNPTIKKFNSENSETTLKQQILILYYFGILESIQTDIYKNKNLIISKLLNRSETKVKAALTYLDRRSEHNSFTTANLESVIKILETAGFSEQAKNAKRDLEKQK